RERPRLDRGAPAPSDEPPAHRRLPHRRRAEPARRPHRLARRRRPPDAARARRARDHPSRARRRALRRCIMNVMTRSTEQDLALFEAHRAPLVALAYRMLGDVARAEDVVQEAWLRWRGRREEVDAPRAYLVTMVTRLCLNELDSATARREESRGD